MLYVLTGAIQTGKTRWLEAMTRELEARGVSCAGVLSPGVWRKHPGVDGEATGFEKLGIEVVLLPQGERLPFATRRDLLEAGPHEAVGASATREADRAGLGWAIRDEAIAAVNAHFDRLAAERNEAQSAQVARAAQGARAPQVTQGAQSAQVARAAGGADAAARQAATTQDAAGREGLLVVDELGRLELEFGGGYTSAMRLLEAGPSARWPKALIVVREQLAETARSHFGSAWKETTILTVGQHPFPFF
jgi:nucleoside-triphosphatase THEP1